MKHIIAIIISALPLSGFAQQKPDSSNVLDDVTVKESFESGFIEEKLPLQLKLDLSNVVQIKERVHWSSVDPTSDQNAGSGAILDLQ